MGVCIANVQGEIVTNLRSFLLPLIFPQQRLLMTNASVDTLSVCIRIVAMGWEHKDKTVFVWRVLDTLKMGFARLLVVQMVSETLFAEHVPGHSVFLSYKT